MSSPPSSSETPLNKQARALWFLKRETCELRQESLRSPVSDEVLVRTEFSGISRGTESLVFKGKVPEQERERMRGPGMGGDFTFPVKYGYANVGRIVEGPEQLLGRSVFSLHPHQSAFVIETQNVSLLPAELPPQRAVLSANMETALNIIWDASILPGDRVLIFGAGVVGALTGYLASRIPGTEVILVDPNSSKNTIAMSLGICFSETLPQHAEFDVLINTSASGDALQNALDCAGFEARIVEASWHGTEPLTLYLGGAFHSKRLSLISSQVGAVANGNRARWDYSRRLNKAMELLTDDTLDVLISGETLFDEIAAAYGEVINNPNTLCHRIRY